MLGIHVRVIGSRVGESPRVQCKHSSPATPPKLELRHIKGSVHPCAECSFTPRAGAPAGSPPEATGKFLQPQLFHSLVLLKPYKPDAGLPRRPAQDHGFYQILREQCSSASVIPYIRVTWCVVWVIAHTARHLRINTPYGHDATVIWDKSVEFRDSSVAFPSLRTQTESK